MQTSIIIQVAYEPWYGVTASPSEPQSPAMPFALCSPANRTVRRSRRPSARVRRHTCLKPLPRPRDHSRTPGSIAGTSDSSRPSAVQAVAVVTVAGVGTHLVPRKTSISVADCAYCARDGVDIAWAKLEHHSGFLTRVTGQPDLVQHQATLYRSVVKERTCGDIEEHMDVPVALPVA